MMTRKSIEISFIEFDSSCAQICHQLVAKGLSSMMLLLSLYVSLHPCKTRIANRKGRVSVLPLKPAM